MSTPLKKKGTSKSEPDTPESHVQAAKKKTVQKVDSSSRDDDEKKKKTKTAKEPHCLEPDGSNFFSFPLYELGCVGDLVLVGGGGGSVASGIPNMFGLFRWEKETHSLKRILLEHNNSSVVTNGTIAPQQDLVAIGRGRVCVIWELKKDSLGNARQVQTEDDPKDSAEDDDSEQKSCIFSRSGKTLLCAGTSGRVNVIDVKSMTQIFAIEENKSNDGPVTKLAVHSDSDHIVSLTASAVRVWLLTDEKSGVLSDCVRHSVSSLSSLKSAQLRGASFAKSLLAVGVVSRLQKQSQVFLLGGNSFDSVVRVISSAIGDPQTCLSTSRDGNLIATGTAEGAVCVYSVSGSRVMSTRPHSFFVSGVCFSPDSKYIMSVSGDCSLRTQLIVQQRNRTLFLILLSLLVLLIAVIVKWII